MCKTGHQCQSLNTHFHHCWGWGCCMHVSSSFHTCHLTPLHFDKDPTVLASHPKAHSQRAVCLSRMSTAHRHARTQRHHNSAALLHSTILRLLPHSGRTHSLQCSSFLSHHMQHSCQHSEPHPASGMCTCCLLPHSTPHCSHQYQCCCQSIHHLHEGGLCSFVSWSCARQSSSWSMSPSWSMIPKYHVQGKALQHCTPLSQLHDWHCTPVRPSVGQGCHTAVCECACHCHMMYCTCPSCHMCPSCR